MRIILAALLALAVVSAPAEASSHKYRVIHGIYHWCVYTPVTCFCIVTAFPQLAVIGVAEGVELGLRMFSDDEELNDSVTPLPLPVPAPK